jgi:hydrogenase maturation protein HypF
MELEFALDQAESDDAYRFEIQQGFCAGDDGKLLVVDWAPIVLALIDDVGKNMPIGRISRRFHNTLSEIIVAVARYVEERRIVLTGGCFQNQYLTERTVHRLHSEGFRPYWHQRVPPNDGGVALGQAVIAARRIQKRPLSHQDSKK